MQAKRIFLATLLAACISPAHAQGVPASLQGHWVGNAGTAMPKAAQLRALCRNEVHDENASSLNVGANRLIHANIGATTTAENLRFATREAMRAAGRAQVSVVYEDESSEPPSQGHFDLRLRNNTTLEMRASWLEGTALYFRCPR